MSDSRPGGFTARRPFLLATLLMLVAVPLLTGVMGQGEASPAPSPMFDPDLGVPIGEPLLSIATDAPPAMDGAVEAAWDRALALAVPLHHGLHGDDAAGTIELRSLHDGEYIYFLARWPSETPGGEPGAAQLEQLHRNLLTVHWRLVDSGLVSGESTGSDGLACTVACHTATADGQGRLIGMRAETIPPGLDDDLPSGGSWALGEWLVEWSRPRVSSSPYDQHLTDPASSYRFFVKLFQGVPGQADPVSDVHELRLER
jgi:hypothetical protein